MSTDERFDRLEKYLLEFRDEMSRRLEVIENRLDFLSTTVANLDARMPPMSNALLESGVLSSRLVRDQADLAGRLTRLEEKVARLMEPAA
jgi:hypothetical protein